MKNLILPLFIVIPTLAACSSDAPKDPVEIVDAGAADLDSPSPKAFDLNSASLVIYELDGGSEFCISDGNILDFTLNLNTSDATIGLAVLGDIATDTCLSELEDVCLIRAEHRIQVTQTQTETLLALIGEIPDPMCVVDNGRVCDFCLVETLLVDSQTVDTGCCGEVVPTFGPKLAALVAYLQTLVPVPEPPPERAFSNPKTFNTLSYSTGGFWGYCPQEGTVTDALITRSTTGQKLTITGTRATIGDRATDTCIEDTWHDDNCYVAKPFGPLILDQDQVIALENALTTMPAPLCVEDPGLACDPCFLHYMTVDGVSVDDTCCGTMPPGFYNDLSTIIKVIDAVD